MDLDIIFFIGPQGSGKGTQAKLLAHKLGFFYWEMSSVLREAAAAGDALGQEILKMQNEGTLVPDEITTKVIEKKFIQLRTPPGFVFDGVPRRLGQAQMLVETLKAQGHTKFLTLFIDLPREESIKRLMLRAQHEARKDDTQAGIERRFAFYEKETIPMLDYMRGQTEFLTIDGLPPIEEVTKLINTALELP